MDCINDRVTRHLAPSLSSPMLSESTCIRSYKKVYRIGEALKINTDNGFRASPPAASGSRISRDLGGRHAHGRRCRKRGQPWQRFSWSANPERVAYSSCVTRVLVLMQEPTRDYRRRSDKARIRLAGIRQHHSIQNRLRIKRTNRQSGSRAFEPLHMSSLTNRRKM
jgi:hypothetical protein